jgi:hypothetical protein
LAVLDFPTSPTDGQIYSNWIYSTAKGAWKAKPLTAIKTVTSDTPPASPSNGDQWFNTLDGTLYIYVTDIDSSQWVESRAPITADGYYSPNYIINGGMDIWQRGTSFTNTAVAEYTADRWVELTSSMTSARSTDVPNPNFAYSLQSTVSSATYNTTAQRIESAVIRQAGEVVTLSFWAKSLIGSNGIRVDFRYPSAVDNFASTASFGDVIISETLASSWTRYSTTISLVDLARTNGLEIRILRSNNAVSSSFLLTGVQLEQGSVASTFRRNANSIQGELAACQRYYEKSYNIDVAPGASTSIGRIYGSGSAPTTGFLSHSFIFKVTKRGTPVVVCYDSNGLINAVNREYIGTGTSAGNAVSIPATVTSTSHFLAYSSGTYNATALSAHFTSDAEL